MPDFLRLFAAVIALISIIHFGCVCNFLPPNATRKIKTACVACVVCGAMLLGCTFDDDSTGHILYYLLLLNLAFMAYELATWLDGINVCDYYANRNGEKQ